MSCTAACDCILCNRLGFVTHFAETCLTNSTVRYVLCTSGYCRNEVISTRTQQITNDAMVVVAPLTATESNLATISAFQSSKQISKQASHQACIKHAGTGKRASKHAINKHQQPVNRIMHHRLLRPLVTVSTSNCITCINNCSLIHVSIHRGQRCIGTCHKVIPSTGM
jgi:hypothetical protein